MDWALEGVGLVVVVVTGDGDWYEESPCVAVDVVDATGEISGARQRRFGDGKDKCKLLIGGHVVMMSEHDYVDTKITIIITTIIMGQMDILRIPYIK